MGLHKIAGLYVDLYYKGRRLFDQALPYKCDEDVNPDFTICFPDEYIIEQQKENPHLSLNECEYIWTGSAFYTELVHYNGILLHSSCVMYEGVCYLFSAPSGTGKSTHTQLWLKTFGEGAQILNDDKPAIRVEGDEVVAYGTPWSGKTDLAKNVRVPIKAICFIERSAENWIHKESSANAIALILNQTVRPNLQENMDQVIETLDKIIRKVPVYKMGCNISEEAARMAYDVMSKGKEDNNA